MSTDNLALAREAIGFTRSIVKYTSSNDNHHIVATMWAKRNIPRTAPITYRNLRRVERSARKHRAGNCGEMAAVALFFLAEQNRHTGGLWYVQLAGKKCVTPRRPATRCIRCMKQCEDLDHAFVVIGLKGGDWREAVVCDPWGCQAYGVPDPRLVHKQMKCFYQINQIDGVSHAPYQGLFGVSWRSLT